LEAPFKKGKMVILKFIWMLLKCMGCRK